MSNNELSYPEQEYRSTPTNTLEQLQDELHLYATAEDLRASITGLKKLYEAAPLLQGLHECSNLLIGAESYVNPTLSASDLCEDFYHGAVLAMHCLLQPQPVENWQDILNKDPLEVISIYEESETMIDEDHAMVILAEFQDTFWRGLFAGLEPEAQETLIKAAAQFFADQGSSEERKSTFMAGFMFTDFCLAKS